MPIVQHKYLHDRAGFFDTLDRAIVDARRLRGAAPGFAPIESILYQLETMKVWTSNGRQPTRDERRRITMAQTIVREFEPAPTDEIFFFGEMISELSFYFKLWWDDPEWAGMDRKDPRLDFPDD